MPLTTFAPLAALAVFLLICLAALFAGPLGSLFVMALVIMVGSRW